MNDFPAELKKDWAEQHLEIKILTRQLQQSAIVWRRLLIVSVIGAGIGVAFGIWFAWTALSQRDLFHALAALTMLAAVPPAAVAEFRARRNALKWHDPTPEGVIRQALERVDATARLLRITCINGLTLIGLSALVWIFVLLGSIDRRPSLIFATLVWLGFGVMALAWARWRGRANARTGERCQRLLRDYAAADDQAD